MYKNLLEHLYLVVHSLALAQLMKQQVYIFFTEYVFFNYHPKCHALEFNCITLEIIRKNTELAIKRKQTALRITRTSMGKLKVHYV